MNFQIINLKIIKILIIFIKNSQIPLSKQFSFKNPLKFKNVNKTLILHEPSNNTNTTKPISLSTVITVVTNTLTILKYSIENYSFKSEHRKKGSLIMSQVQCLPVAGKNMSKVKKYLEDARDKEIRELDLVDKNITSIDELQNICK